VILLPLTEGSKWLYTPQYHEKPINSVKSIVTRGDCCDLCEVIGAFEYDGERMFKMSSTPGEIYTLDK